MALVSPIYARKIGKRQADKLKWKRRALRAEAALSKRQRASLARARFYDSPEWQKLRYQALSRASGCCELCGASKASGAKLHVDHIKPRSKYPQLELDLANLQVLCQPCNLGKGAWDETDWRKPELRVVGGIDRPAPNRRLCGGDKR